MKEGFSSFLQDNFQSLEDQLDAVLPELSRLEAQVAQYMRLNIADLSFETGASLAEKAGVSEVTVSRLLRRLGYEGMRGLKRELRNQLANPEQLAEVANAGLEVPRSLSGVLDLELEAIRDVFRQCSSQTWEKIVDTVAGADRVYVTGFQTVRGIAEDCARRMALARGDVRFLSAHDGMLAEWLATAGDRDAAINECLVLIDVVAYAREAPALAEICIKTGRSLVMITDETCHWAKNHTDMVIHASTRNGLFLESTVAITSALNLIVDSVAKQNSKEVATRLQDWKVNARALNLF